MNDVQRSMVELNAAQIKVLDWIKEGCPAGVFPEDNFSHRISAKALESRGMVRISGHGKTWRASVTERGKAWPVATAEDKAAIEISRRAAEVDAKASAENAGKLPRPARIPVEQRRRIPVAKELSRAEKRQRLVDDLTKRVLLEDKPIVLMEERWEYNELDWMRKAAEKSAERPHGQVLAIRSTGWREEGNYVISLEPCFRDLVEVVEIEVPDRVGKYHSAAKEFLDEKGWHPVDKDIRPRAARILHAMAKEAERRGINVLSRSAAKKKHRGNDRGWHSGSWIVFETEHRDYGFEIWSSKGQLNMRQGDPPSSYGSTTFGDRKIVRLEDRLAEAFVRFEIWRLEQAYRKEQWRLEQERKQRAWEAAMAKARVAYVEHVKWEHFKGLSNTSGTIEQHRQFLELSRQAIDRLPEAERQVTADYLGEMEVVIDSLDPLVSPELFTPEIKEPKESELEPFLHGWSPYGPDGR
ncbi:hypothetical protein [Leucobacter aridicollis]|uniref:hypothetical protein n=1 Tax=Leucobacter aridicollis TaxID=283878 RepID=UPI00216A3385|nr:hypothetical protein [Leucobacter aridicollis]MCS3427112.1 hypothetical protein [Leucobacter aridicollis]